MANDRIDEMQNLNKQIDFNNLVYYFKSESGPKHFINFKGPLGFCKNVKDKRWLFNTTKSRRKSYKK